MTKSEGRTLLDEERLWTLWQAAANTASLGLPAAEIGSFRGGSAAFLARAFALLRGRPVPLHVVDTFEGHPDVAVPGIDSSDQRPGLFGSTSVEDVRRYLGELADVHVHQGQFADVVETLAQDEFGLVHLDVDLYEPTLAALQYFSRRMPVGGVVVVDDFDAKKCPGVRAAVEAFDPSRAGFQTWTPHTEQVVLAKVLDRGAS